MRNTILNRVINFVKNVEPKVWFTTGTACIFVLVLWLFSIVAGSLFDLLKELERERNAQQEVYMEAIEEVKRNCDLAEKIIRQKSVTYTYSCDGAEYQFNERL